MNRNSNNPQYFRLMTSFFRQTFSLISFIIINGVMLSFCLILPLFIIVFHNPKSLKENQVRSLNEDESNATKPSMKNIYDYEYTFLNNITMIDYIGEWHEMKINNQSFLQTNEGIAEMVFSKVKNKHYVFSHSTNNSFNVVFYIKEGKYIDNYLKGNFSLSFPNNFIDDLHDILQDNTIKNELIISGTNISIDLHHSQIFSISKHNFSLTNITLSFEKNRKYLRDSFEKMIISPFASANLTIRGDFSINIQTEIQISNEIEAKVRNYAFILTILSFVDIYLTFSLLVEVNDNNQIGLNLDLITIIISVLYKSFITTVHLYLSLTTNNEEMSYEYGIPSIVSLLSFSLFEVRLLIFSWKARNIGIIFTNPNLFRRKMFIFYSLFYVSQFLSLISIKTIFSNFWGCFLLFLCTWTFQIIHSIRTGTRPPMSNSHILLSTLTKLFLPIYLKAYDGNAFELRPSYFKVTVIVVCVLIQMIILLMQKQFGAKIIVPKCWKTLPYNYYKETINVDEHVSHNPDCVICLDNLKEDVDQEAQAVENNSTIIKKKDSYYFFAVKSFVERINKYFQSLSAPIKHQKYMITPCDHIYHSVCLEKWMKLKNECPYCKRSIPPLE